jgi:uncharacterized membrane protein YphA (DoxX/SURF4 family)
MVSGGNDDVRKGSQNVNTTLWVAQGLLAALFLFSGLMKSTQSEEKLVASGQTGVAGLPRPLIRFIGVSEILGAAGLVLPLLSNVMPILTPLAAIGLGLIMILAALVHYRREEKRTASQNLFILLVCLFVAYGRWRG